MGYWGRLGTWLLVLFPVPVTVVMHHFWTFPDPMQHEMQKIQFMKNLSLPAAALMIAYFGSGPLSIMAGRGIIQTDKTLQGK